MYGLKEGPVITHGHATIEYDSKNILDGKYKAWIERKSDVDKNTAEITLSNEFYPIGINYFHTVEKGDNVYVSLFFIIKIKICRKIGFTFFFLRHEN